VVRFKHWRQPVIASCEATLCPGTGIVQEENEEGPTVIRKAPGTLARGTQWALQRPGEGGLIDDMVWSTDALNRIPDRYS
jgi:hypothetical protein